MFRNGFNVATIGFNVTMCRKMSQSEAADKETFIRGNQCVALPSCAPLLSAMPVNKDQHVQDGSFPSSTASHAVQMCKYLVQRYKGDPGCALVLEVCSNIYLCNAKYYWSTRWAQGAFQSGHGSANTSVLTPPLSPPSPPPPQTPKLPHSNAVSLYWHPLHFHLVLSLYLLPHEYPVCRAKLVSHQFVSETFYLLLISSHRCTPHCFMFSV